ncbi:MAG TPA: hypothetical protein VNQ73_17130 [Ilumatobacter sp.]|nr:hypothetical protein [Ilumatobacter sp.]
MRELGRAIARRAAWLDRWYLPISIAALALAAAVAVLRMEQSTADFDPQFMRVVVERTMRFGGGYYENAIHNKGPLEPVVYEAAARLGGRDGFWLVIAVFTLGSALCVGAAAALVALRSGAARAVAAAVAAAVVAHLTLSEADYAGVLYARNIAVALLGLALAVTVLDRCWATPRRRWWAVWAVGTATGLAVQTMFTACFTAVPVLLYAMWTRRHERVGGRPAWWWLPAASAVAFSSALVWYGLADLAGRRSFGDFVDGWWRYARFMSDATGRGPAGQAALAWSRGREYYADRPAVAGAVAVWAVVAAVRFRRAGAAERALVALLATWFLGAWVELAVSQRYSSHYFSVLVVPTLLIAAQLAGWATARWRAPIAARPVGALLPLVATLVTVQVGGTAPFGVGIETLSTTHSTAALADRADAGRGGRVHFERAVLSAFSSPGDPLLAWTSYPWVYLDRERVSATRYIWKQFLLGEIYLGGRSDDYVFPGTWERWEADLVAANPVGYLVEATNPVEQGTPFERVVAERFRPVHADDEATLALRNDLVGWLTGPPSAATPLPTEAGNRLADRGCARIDGTLGSGETTFVIGPGAEATIVVWFDGTGAATVESNRLGVAGYHAFVAPGTTDFTLVAGARATLLAIGGEVVGAVEVGGTTIDLTGPVAATGLTTSAPHPLSGC